MLLRQHFRRHDVGRGGLHLVVQAAHHAAFALHHCLESVLCDFRRIVLFVRADLGVHHVGAAEKFRFGRPRHEARHRDMGLFQLFPQRVGKGIEKRLGAVIDGLIGARHEACDRSCDEDAAFALGTHVAADLWIR